MSHDQHGFIIPRRTWTVCPLLHNLTSRYLPDSRGGRATGCQYNNHLQSGVERLIKWRVALVGGGLPVACGFCRIEVKIIVITIKKEMSKAFKGSGASHQVVLFAGLASVTAARCPTNGNRLRFLVTPMTKINQSEGCKSYNFVYEHFGYLACQGKQFDQPRRCMTRRLWRSSHRARW